MRSQSRDFLVISTRHSGASVPASLDEMELLPLGSLDEVKAALERVFPGPTWLDAWAAVTDGNNWMAEISVAVGNPVRQLTLKMTGSDSLTPVRRLCEQNGWRAVDLEEWNFVA